MKIRNIVHIILDEENKNKDLAEGKLVLGFTDATIPEVLKLSQAAAKFRDKFVEKLEQKVTGKVKGAPRNKWDIPESLKSDHKGYQRAQYICRTLGMKYPQALLEWTKRKKKGAKKGDTKQQPVALDPPVDPPVEPAEAPKPGEQPGDAGAPDAGTPGGQPAAAKPPATGRQGTGKRPVRKTPREPSPPRKMEPRKSMNGFTVGDQVKQIAGPEAIPGTGEIIGFSEKPGYTRNIQVKFLHHTRWLSKDQLQIVKKAEP